MLEQKSVAPYPAEREKVVAAPPSQQKYKRKPSRYRRLTLALVLLGLVLVLAGGFFTFRNVKARLDSGTAHFQLLQNQLKDPNLNLTSTTLQQLQQQLQAAGDDFQQAREGLGPYALVLPLASWLPGVGYDAANLDRLLDLAEKTARIGSLVLDGAQPALNYFELGATGDASSKLSAAGIALTMPAAQTRFALASLLFEELSQRRATLDPTKLNFGQARKAMEQLDQQLPNLKEVLQLLHDLPPLLPEVLGQIRPVTYLTLIQNSDELRPTGGFISAVGLLTVNNGKPSLSNFQDSYAVDNPKIPPTEPPEALTRYMQATHFVLRDANWWPDFPTSARQLAALYRQNQAVSVDNVLAIDSQAVTYFFETLGPLDLPNYNEHLTAQNFEERLRYYYLPPGTQTNGDWWVKRKEFIGVVMNGLLERLNNASAHDYLKLAISLGKALQEKHLQIYFSQPALETQLTQRSLDSAQKDVSSGMTDYLMVVDSNVGFNKINPKIERSINYIVSSGGTGASIFASLTLTYTNRAEVRQGTQPGECVKVAKYDTDYLSMQNGCYWDYLRVYVPPGSILGETIGFSVENRPTISSENNKTVFATQLIVPPGESRRVTFNYTLPLHLSSDRAYGLIVQQQAGIRPSPMVVQLKLAQLSRQWAVTLDSDQRFDLK